MSDLEQTTTAPGAKAKPEKPRWRVRARAGTWRFLAAGLGLVAVAGLIWPVIGMNSGQDGHGSAARAAATDQSSTPRVEVVRPVRGGVRRLTIQPGTVHAFESVDLYAKASGFLQTQNVDIGSPIKAGQVLAEIDAPELQRDVDESDAVLAQAQAQAELAVARVATAKAEREADAAEVTQAEAEVLRFAAKLSLSQKQYNRVSELFTRSAVDRKLVDEQQYELEAARAGERSSQAAVQTARAQVAAADAKVRQAQADAHQARAAVRVADARRERAKVMAAYIRITAPFDGVVTRRTFSPGAFIRSAADGSSEPLLTVMRTDLMRVVIHVPDLDVPLLDVGDQVTVVVDALKGKEFVGTIARLGKLEDPNSRTMRAEVDLPNPEGQFVEGMYGRATIVLQPPTENLTVPAACMVGHVGRGKASVFVVRDGKAHKTPVTLGGDDGASVEVLSGLGPDDDVVVRPGTTLDDGATVQSERRDK